MNIKIGDKVRFLNERGEGIITKIINKTTVGVTIEDGFELPFLISQVIVISDNVSTASIIKTVAIPVVHFENKNVRNNKKIYVAISPEKIDDIANSNFNYWVINHTAYDITLSFSILKSDGFETLSVVTINSDQTQLIETISKNEMGDFSNFKIDILFHHAKPHAYQAPISESIKLKAVKLYKENAFIENNFVSEKAFLITIFDPEEDAPENVKEVDPKNSIDFSKFLFQKQTHTSAPQKSKPNNNKKELEIDLHIEELLDDYSGMTNSQIIQAQLNHFQKALNKAIDNKYQRMIVIHGVGNGKLKQEVRTILNSYSMQYFDAAYSKYGYGATEIIISN